MSLSPAKANVASDGASDGVGRGRPSAVCHCRRGRQLATTWPNTCSCLYRALNLAPKLARWLLERGLPGAFGYFNARTQYFDEVLLQEARAGLEQVVILGAGFDSRSLRFSDALGNGARIRSGPARGVGAQTEHLLRAGSRRRVSDRGANRFRARGSRPCHCVSGDTPRRRGRCSCGKASPTTFQKTPSEQSSSLVASQSGSGSSILFDYVTRAFVDGDYSGYGARRLADGWRRLGNVNRFGVDDVAAFMPPIGLKASQRHRCGRTGASLPVVVCLVPPQSLGLHAHCACGRSWSSPLGTTMLAGVEHRYAANGARGTCQILYGVHSQEWSRLEHGCCAWICTSGGLMATGGATLPRVAPGEVVLEVAFRPELTQQHGFLHAGIVTSVMDSACGYAALSLMDPGTAVLTVEFKVNLLAPARGTRFRATGGCAGRANRDRRLRGVPRGRGGRRWAPGVHRSDGWCTGRPLAGRTTDAVRRTRPGLGRLVRQTVCAIVRQRVAPPARSTKVRSHTKKSQSKSAAAPSALITPGIDSLGDWRGEMLSRLRALNKEADAEVPRNGIGRRRPGSAQRAVCTGEPTREP